MDDVPCLSNLMLVEVMRKYHNNVNEGMQVSINEGQIQWKPSEITFAPLKLKEFEAFLEYKDRVTQRKIPKVRLKDLKKSMFFTSPQSERGTYSEATTVTPSPTADKLPLIIKYSVPKKLAKEESSKELEPKKEAPVKHRSRSLSKPKERSVGLPKIFDSCTLLDKKKEKYRPKYSLDVVRRHRISEPKMINPFADCHSPIRVYQKAEYLSKLPVNPEFDISKLDSRIEKLCRRKALII